MPDRVRLDSQNPSRRRFLAAGAAASGGVLLALAGCGPQKSSAGHIQAPGVDVSGPRSLKVHAANAHMLFGFAVDTEPLRHDAAYRALVQEQCSLITAENALKWHALRPTPDQYQFDDADELLTFAESSHIKLRGHALCWHNALPDWFAGYANPSNARGLLTDHIRTVAGRYSGRMHSWDVVNEAIEVRDGRNDGLRNSPWLRLIGTDYIEVAFRVAREADPAALLTYNEYGIESETQEAAEKRAAVLLLLRRLKQRDVPIDAIGIQSHLRGGAMYGYGAGLRQFMASCRSMGLEIFLSEMDVNDRDLPDRADARDEAVAETYQSYLKTALQDRGVTSVVTWGVSDRRTWLNTGGEARRDRKPQRPLLFDENLRAKPAFAAVRDAFDARFPSLPPLPPLRGSASLRSGSKTNLPKL